MKGKEPNVLTIECDYHPGFGQLGILRQSVYPLHPDKPALILPREANLPIVTEPEPTTPGQGLKRNRNVC